ncbi:hypothetical protein OHA74_54245 [Streptomyces phaeochromogenes]|uniref:hypothetical protein n=1 Tax=Streptomyces phaeochromogenes TaxID=1923 RepID=UPI002E29BD07|nr:hypothetical protein [Streptomyces phaeochromogenes]
MAAVFGSQPLHVPVGRDAHRWNTFHGERTLVVAARTVTSTVRVLESLPALLHGDSRVRVVFAYDPTSAFNAGVVDLLHDAGCRVMPWKQLGHIAPDLILSASENIDVPEGDCPVLVLPHGVGFQKLVPDSRSSRDRLSGVVPDPLLETGRAWLAVSHPAQEEQLLATHPKAAGRTLLVGDPCFDELVGSQPRKKAYREALGVAEHQRLVMVSSTWGSTSLLGSLPDLIPRLLAQLPYDEYRVGAIIHPNVWSAHGAWQIHTLQAAALEAGLLLMPAVHAWRPALVAADVLLGDHGSVTLYGASAGTPLLLAAFGGDAVPGTAAHKMASAAPRLDPRADLLQQVEDVVREHTPQRYAAVAKQAFAEPGHALARLRTALYHLLKLPEPSAVPPSPLMLPVPDPPASPVTSWQVTASVTEDGGELAITVCRFPAAVSVYDAAHADSPASFAYLACTDEERDHRLTQSASVLVQRHSAPTSVGALRWIQDRLAQLPGSLLAASAVRGSGCLVGLRDGRVVEATATGPAMDPGLLAAAVYACLRAGHPLDDTRVLLRIGETREEDVVLRLRPALPVR